MQKSLFERIKIESKSLTSPAKSCNPYGRNTFTLKSRNHTFGIFTSFMLNDKKKKKGSKQSGRFKSYPTDNESFYFNLGPKQKIHTCTIVSQFGHERQTDTLPAFLFGSCLIFHATHKDCYREARN